MIGAEKEAVLKRLNLYFESPEAVRAVKAVEALPPDVAGRSEYIGKLQKMSLDELKREMRGYGLKPGSKAMMRQRLEMVWDALHPNSPMLRRLNHHIAATQRAKAQSDDQQETRKRTGGTDLDAIFNILLS